MIPVNSYMMKKRKNLSWLSLLLSLALFVAVALWVGSGVREAAAASEREGLRQAEMSVRRAAVSVYALEGAYPRSYEDLKARSGLAIDETRYRVVYEVFASNLMPEITVLRWTP